jgi:hypothetical protein
MISALEWIAEERIARAVAAGELSGLPGEGRPLVLDDDPLVPAERRMVMRVMKNSGCVPEEVRLLKELHELEREWLSAEEHERLAVEGRLLHLRLQLEQAGFAASCGIASGKAWAQYEPKLRARLLKRQP